ncbi:CBS domain-containing protein [Rhizobium sp. 2YAF20]|uniref:CBS domain-containing protein n=1 Tax=Rhizobium sp. 2YAF20 TaxID=3233027 RepID=UPI003F99EB79
MENRQEQHRHNVVERTSTIDEIAHIMRRDGIDTVLVVENGVLIGSVTDRDLAIKGLAPGLHPRAHRLGCLDAHARSVPGRVDTSR